LSQPVPDQVLEMARELTRPCTDCVDGFKKYINGQYMRKERRDAHVTLSQAAKACGIGTSQLSRMERGEETFQPGYAELLDRFYARRRRSGPE